MALHSSTLAWKIPWAEEPGRLQSMGSLRVGHNWATSLSLFTFHFNALEKEMATYSSVLAWRIPGTAEPGVLPSLGSHRVGHDWSDLAAAVAVLENTALSGHYLPGLYFNARNDGKAASEIKNGCRIDLNFPFFCLSFTSSIQIPHICVNVLYIWFSPCGLLYSVWSLQTQM